jgi:formate-dependent nitrite reductase membrane component NrfD
MAEDGFRSYYGRPVLKEPVWKPEIPWYFFTGGLAGASSGLALGARLAGNDILARRALLAAAAGSAVSPILLIKDLGRPERFYNMLRVFKVTSPMSVGSWILAAYGSTTGFAAAAELLGILPRLRAAAEAGSALLGLGMSTYTGALVADTAIPIWHEARRELPFAFGGGAAATAGAAGVLTTPPELAGPARRLALAGAVLELAAMQLMEKRLGAFLAEPYREGRAGALTKLAKGLSVVGAGMLVVAGRRRAGAVVGGSLLLAGGACARWAVFKAGFASARDPKYTIVPQRRRLETRAAR